MKIIVISITPYKEKDGIVDAISENGSLTFLARGILDPKSKNAGLNTNLVVADIELSEGKYKYPLLTSVSILESPMKLKTDYYYLGTLMVINEVTKLLIQDEEKASIYPSLLEALSSLKVAKDPWIILLIYLTRVFKYTGYEFEVNRCVFCGNTKRIKTFSFADGGFVCEECLDKNTERDLTNEQMLLLREAVNAKSFSLISPYATKDNSLVIFTKFVEFIADAYGIHLKNAVLLNK